MKTYAFVTLKVNGADTASLDIYEQGNVFTIYEHDATVFRGSWRKAIEYIHSWKAKYHDLISCMIANNMDVHWEQSIR